MNIPESVRIGGRNYAVVWESRLNNGVNMLMGQIGYEEGWIKLNPDYPDRQEIFQTLLHETLHGIAYHFDADWRTNEDLIDEIARGLFMVIADNPDMFELEANR